MSQIVKPVMLDETGQITNQKLEELSSKINTVLTNYANQMSEIAQESAVSQNQNFQQFANQMGGSMTTLANAIVGQADELNEIVGALTSVKSINGKYGVVVLDSGDILISKNTAGSKTVNQVLGDMQFAISNTPVNFGVSHISGDEYLLIVSLDASANIYNTLRYTENSYLKPDGSIGSYNTFRVSDFVGIPNGATRVSLTNYATFSGDQRIVISSGVLGLYDENKQFIELKSPATTECRLEEFNISSNVKFIRTVSCINTLNNELYIG